MMFPKVPKILREFRADAIHEACGYKDWLNARWVRYANGNVNCEVINKTCPNCLSGGTWAVDPEVVKSYYDPAWGAVGTA